MRTATKATRTYSLDRQILSEVRKTKGKLSESERVNRLLRTALDLENRAALEGEIADFFANAPEDRVERRAFETAGEAAWMRD